MHACVVSFKSQLDETRYLAAVLNQGAAIEPCPGTDRYKIWSIDRDTFDELYAVAKYFRAI